MIDITSLLLTLLGFTIFAIGIVMTKAGGSWFGWKGKKDKRFVRALLIWIGGFALYNLSVIPNGIASRQLPPYIISAVSGWSISVMVILSWLFLKEKLFKSDLILTLSLMAGIFFLNLFDRQVADTSINMTAFYLVLAAPLLLLVPALLPGRTKRGRAIFLATFAGCTGGLALVVMNVVVKSLGFDVFAYLDKPFLYLYLLCGASSFVSLQIALRNGTMILIGPIQNASMILYPVAASYFIFGAALVPLQLLMILVIAGSVVMILRKH